MAKSSAKKPAKQAKPSKPAGKRAVVIATKNKKAPEKPMAKAPPKAVAKAPPAAAAKRPQNGAKVGSVEKNPKAVIAKSSKPQAPAPSRPSAIKAVSQRSLPIEPAYSPPIPTTVFSDGKPKKNQAGISSRELEVFREALLAKRRELVGDMSSMEREALRSASGSNLSNLPLHMADMGTDNYEQEFTLGLVEKDRRLLREINAALAKIQSGTYGICEGTGKPISKARLEAQPWAKYSIEYAREMEKGRLR